LALRGLILDSRRGDVSHGSASKNNFQLNRCGSSCSRMSDLTNPKIIKLKGLLFLVMGALASLLLIVETPTLRQAALLAIAVWSFCRFYYFAFYVIEHYVDPSFRFSGLMAFAGYLLKRRNDKAR
jgi:hypothetical protein